jgi:hypothetical protein
MTTLRRTAAGLSLAGVLTLLACSSLTSAEGDKTAAQSYRVKLDSEMAMKIQNQTVKLTALTQFAYALRPKGNKVDILLNKVELEVKQNGKEMLKAVSDKDKQYTRQNGRVTTDVSRDKADEKQKQTMDDTFTKPLGSYVVDKNGKELKRSVSSAPGAKAMIKRGVVVNARLFHPPFYQDKDKWQAPSAVSLGDGDFVKGDLTYTKGKGGKVKVAGVLTNKMVKKANGLVMKDIKYVVKGEQTYDAARKQWTSGKLAMNVSFSMEFGGKEIGSATGEMKATLGSGKK